MLCEKCGKNEATVKFVQIENTKRTELHLCQKCAMGYTNVAIGLDLPDFLSSMFKQGSLAGKLEQSIPQKACSTCGRTLKEVQKTGRLGCSDCYKVFKEELNPVLKKLHGSISHTGKVPGRAHPKARVSRQIDEIRKRLEECIQVEDYEQAASYRDEIRELENELAEGE